MKITRRGMILSAGVIGGGALVGFAATRESKHRQANRLLNAAEDYYATAWISVSPDNLTTVYVPHVEMGQGVHTALAMMAADEMDADWSLVRVEQAPALDLYTVSDRFRVRDGAAEHFVKDLRDLVLNRDAASSSTQNTAASSSVRATGNLVMRNAGAAARELFLRAAAAYWDVPTEQCETAQSKVHHRVSGRSLDYGELASRAAELEPLADPVLKDPAQFTLMGRSIPRVDMRSKVDGSARFGSDAQPAGTLYAALILCPLFGGRLATVDDSELTAMRGLQRVVKLDDGVAVVADNSWRALQAAARLRVNWEPSIHEAESTATIYAKLQQLLTNDRRIVVEQSGEIGASTATISHTVEASYRVPYLAHAAMEPMSCTVHMTGVGADVWVSTQDPLSTRRRVAQIGALDPDQVTVHPCFLGGAFGRRLPIGWNVIDHATRIASQFDVPVTTLLSREEDTRHDYYRPAVASSLRAELDETGSILNWHHLFTGPLKTPAAVQAPYPMTNRLVEQVPYEHAVPLGNWRSVDYSQQTFFIESFIDEIAHGLGRDPLEFRLGLLQSRLRHRRVLQTAAEISGYSDPARSGAGFGCAIVECFGTVVAHVVEVSLLEDGGPIVQRIICVIDCGLVVNPDSVSAQVESGTLLALSATLQEEIHVERGRVVEGNFDDYSVLRMAQSPTIEVHIMDSNEAPGGVGEAATPSLAPALTNAIFQAGGQRIRELPVGQAINSRA